MHRLMMPLLTVGPQNLFQTVGKAYHSSKVDRFSVCLVWTLGALHWDDYMKRNTLCKTPSGWLLFVLFGSAVLLAHYQMVPEPREEVWTLWPRGEDNRSHASISRLYNLLIHLHCMLLLLVKLIVILQYHTPACAIMLITESSAETKPHLASTIIARPHRQVNEEFKSK